MTRKPSASLQALLLPFDAVLLPLGFRRAHTLDVGEVAMGGDWETDDVLVSAGFEPREDWGDVMIARRMPGTTAFLQPYWSKVNLDDIRRGRGVAVEVRQQRRSHIASDKEIRSWAEGAARSLLEVPDLLAGDNLATLDELIARRPRIGVPGLDFPE